MGTYQKLRVKFILVIALAIFAGVISYPKVFSFWPAAENSLNKLKIHLGLDLQGGIHLEYKADLSQIDSSKEGEAMQALQDVIERRVNAMGVSEPVVYTTQSGNEKRLIVELAGIKDINEAKEQIKETPFLEFKEEKETEPIEIPQEVLDNLNKKAEEKAEEVLDKALEGQDFAELARENSQDPGSAEDGGNLGYQAEGTFVPEFDAVLFSSDLKNGEIYPQLVETQFGWHIIKKIDERTTADENGEEIREVDSAHILIGKQTQPEAQKEFVSTGLTGKNLKGSQVVFENQGLGNPQVGLQFDSEGTKMFSEITKRNIGKRLAIFLDGEIISAPVVQVEISNGEAVITGDFTLDEANDLVRRLNEGALPVPIELISQKSVEASLGQESLSKSVEAAFWGLVLVGIFMIVYYRFLGLIAVFALLIYVALMIAIFKLSSFSPWPITFTLSGIAGFILSIGMAVDANILIFERAKEEIRWGRNISGALEEGFNRAWSSIKDGNLSTILTAVILSFIGTGFVKGFAVILIIGVLVSMFTAIVLVRIILRFISGNWLEKNPWLVQGKIKSKEKGNENN